MVKLDERLDRAFSALGDPTRRAILERLAEGSAAVSELAEPFRMSLPAVMKHIAVLEEAGLTRREKRGRQRICHLEPAALDPASVWIASRKRTWEQRLSALDRHLREER